MDFVKIGNYIINKKDILCVRFEKDESKDMWGVETNEYTVIVSFRSSYKDIDDDVIIEVESKEDFERIGKELLGDKND